MCNSCIRSKCPIESLINCEICNLQCYSEKCSNIHKEKTCINVKNCKDCNSFKGRNHVCNENHKWCKNCQLAVDEEHRCFINPEIKEKEFPDFKGYIFFDYEAYVENGVHVPNLVMAKKVCIECLNENSNCQECEKKFVFYDNKSFCDWLFIQDNFIAIAHNLKGYDGIFIINHIILSFLPTDTMPNILLSGTKVLRSKFRKLKLIDSYSFLSCPLSEFSNTFNLQDMKGYFPHKFNLLKITLALTQIFPITGLNFLVKKRKKTLKIGTKPSNMTVLTLENNFMHIVGVMLCF